MSEPLLSLSLNYDTLLRFPCRFNSLPSKNISVSQSISLPTNHLFSVYMFHPSYHPTYLSLPAKGLERGSHICSLSPLPCTLQPHNGVFAPFSTERALSKATNRPTFLNGIHFPILLFLYCFAIFESGVTIGYIPEPSGVQR